jgi:hypothetical protein
MIYLVKSDDIKFRYFFTDKDKANILYEILKERYHNKAVIQFKTIELSDQIDLPVILDQILIKED